MVESVEERLEGYLELFVASVFAEQLPESLDFGSVIERDVAVATGEVGVTFVEWFFDGSCLCAADGGLEE
mgnify:CR=1 FL=1